MIIRAFHTYSFIKFSTVNEMIRIGGMNKFHKMKFGNTISFSLNLCKFRQAIKTFFLFVFVLLKVFQENFFELIKNLFYFFRHSFQFH